MIRSFTQLVAIAAFFQGTSLAAQNTTLLTDPFLQLPTKDGVHVVWFTEFEGDAHHVLVEGRKIPAATTKLSRMAEDDRSFVATQQGDGSLFPGYTPRNIWRHEAYVDQLNARVPYTVQSQTGDITLTSDTFTLAPIPQQDAPLKILLTSDHQLKPMTPANLQKAVETVGQFDAVFFAGDLQNHPDRASEWFDDTRGLAFFPSLQGRASHALPPDTEASVTYRGGEILQHTPLFPVVGNHETMGRFDPTAPLRRQYNDPRPRAVAEATYVRLADLYNPNNLPAVRDAWIRDNSYNTISYEELFTLPDEGPAGERYYALRFGDVFVIGLNASRIWRGFRMGDRFRGKYREAAGSLDKPDQWGWGEFIFEDLSQGSEQYRWLKNVLVREDFQSAPVKIAVMHHPMHGVGDNSSPVFAHPVQIRDYDETGRLVGLRYEYPRDQDILVNDIEPLLTEAGVQLVHSGHSHVWYRTQSPSGVTFLETSNVGNTYGCYLEGHRERRNWPNAPRFNQDNYARTGDPHGYAPIMPSVFAPMQDEAGRDLPCLASNEMTAFSVLEVKNGAASVKSYVFDTSDPQSDVRLFDEFTLK